MKYNFRVLLIFLILFAKGIQAQFLSEFSALQSGNEIDLDITIAGGNTCNGINVLRSADNINFVSIGGIAGVCGSSTEDVFYSFTDPVPLHNTTNYYRLDLISLGFSTVIDIHFVYFGEDALLLYPNPIRNVSKVYLRANSSDVSTYRINDSRGRLLQEKEGIRGDYFEINRDDWAAGIYFLTVQIGSTPALVRKFMID